MDGSAEDALKQIDDKGYMLPYKFEEGKNLVKVGVNISSQTRTVEKWIARWFYILFLLSESWIMRQNVKQ